MSYIPHTQTDIREMLKVIGASSIDELFRSIPAELKLKSPLKLPEPLCERDITRRMGELAARNLSTDKASVFLGAGCYHHFIPAVVDHLAGRSEFYTAYTPYQAEASQGILQAFFEYQTMICELTNMDVANASLYDGATALAEAILMSLAVTRKKKVILANTIHPEYREVVKTYLKDLDIIVTEIKDAEGVVDLKTLREAMNDDIACVAFQSPNFFGIIEDGDSVSEIVHAKKALLISVVNPISLGLLKPPGDYNADIVCGEGQVLGNPMSFGGPHLGFFATRQEYVRKMPGRLVGETVDAVPNEVAQTASLRDPDRSVGKGKRGFVLTLSTREQHIRREKATSNICTNEGLCALRAAIYLSALGKQGIKEVAQQCLAKAHYIQDKISRLKGFKLLYNKPFFNEFVVQCSKPPFQINKKLLKAGIIGGLDINPYYPGLKNVMLWCATEMNTKEDIDKLIKTLSK